MIREVLDVIYTVTFNPALDYVVHVDDLQIETVNRSHHEQIYYGGKGINISIVLKHLGLTSKALGFVAGFTGKAIEDGVKAMAIETDFIVLREGLSRINVKIKAEVETEINGQGPHVAPDELEALYKKLEVMKSGDVLILAGTIPATLPSNIYEIIMAQLSGKGVEIVVDATKDLLMNVLKYKPFLIKPNHHELRELFGEKLETEEALISRAKELQQMGARNVLISMAGDGAILVTETEKVYKMSAPKGHVKNSVGAGDSMVAGFVASYFKKYDYKEALKFAVATGSATAFSEGLAEADLIKAVYDQLPNRINGNAIKKG